MADILSVTSLYVGINGLLFAFLAINVVRLRWKFSVSLGDGGHDILNRAIRAFGNYAEYAAMVFILLAVLELQGLRPVFLHLIGISFTIGRILHALAIYGKMGTSTLACRIIGMSVTFSILVVGSFWLIFARF